MSDVSAPACTNGVWPPLRPVNGAQKNKTSTMLSPKIVSVDWTARLDGSERCDNRMAAQHLIRDVVRPSSGLKELTQKKKLGKVGERILQQGSNVQLSLIAVKCCCCLTYFDFFLRRWLWFLLMKALHAKVALQISCVAGGFLHNFLVYFFLQHFFLGIKFALV